MNDFMNGFASDIRDNAVFIIIFLLFVCTYYLERIKVKTDAMHYMMRSKLYPDMRD
jgi:hypothetical protein